MPVRIGGVTPLPVVSFRKVEDNRRPFGVHDLQARSYGYNDFSDFARPEHYIRYIEPIETELAYQVEYDMDEQDQEWIDAINAERKKEQMDQVSYETFEIIMDRLEKEYFDLIKHVPKPDTGLPAEDSTCAICDDGEGENSNAIVFCDGCNLAVHQDCYGVPYIPEGQWLCRKCTVSPEMPVFCALCPNEGGAFKQADDGRWAHLLCAIWIPEVVVGNQVFMEPITLTKVPKNRWKLICSICKYRTGACIQCDNRSCFAAFHVSCARKYKLLCAMKNLPGQEDTPLRAYCEKHLLRDMVEAHAEAVREMQQHEDPHNSPSDRSPKFSKFARAHAKTYRNGPPLVPSIIVDHLVDYIGKVQIRKKVPFVLSVCKYWSLKREARRGAPLLKRLHLEPWTTSAAKQQTEEEKNLKLEHLTRLRKDLEKVRMLAELVRKREREKLRQMQVVSELLARCMFPHEPALRLAFERITAVDRLDFFRHPVSKAENPEYFNVVKHPMSWVAIDSNLEKHLYWDVKEFQDHIHLVLDNALLYNPPDSQLHKVAARTKAFALPVLEPLQSLGSTPRQPADLVGDLEPTIDILNLLFQADLVQDCTELLLENDPLDHLFRFELEKLRILPFQSPVPKPSRRQRERTKRVRPPRDYAAERRRRNERLAAEKSVATTPNGISAIRFAIPRTRSARAAAAAFEAEAQDSQRPGSALAHDASNLDAVAASTMIETRPRKRKRMSEVIDRVGEMPPVVDSVGDRESFAMFNRGWVLPVGTKRNHRTPSAIPTVLNPALSRPEHRRSRLVLVNTSSPQENKTFEVDFSVTPHLGKVTVEPRVPHSQGARVQPNLITAVTRVDPSSSDLSDVSEREQVRAAPPGYPQKTRQMDGGSESSDLSDLSDVPSDKERKEPRQQRHPHAQDTRDVPAESKLAAIRKSHEKVYEGGTLVWAKTESYPFFPAVVWEEDDEGVPQAVSAGKAAAERARLDRNGQEPLVLVQYYDNKRSWAWCPPQRLHLFGEDQALDQSMLSQRFRTDHLKSSCRQAYRNAIAEMETEAEKQNRM